MLDSEQKSAGTRYTVPAALLIVAFIFSPTVLIVSRPFGFLSLTLALACSVLCTILAWITWRRWSNLTTLSIVSRHSGQ